MASKEDFSSRINFFNTLGDSLPQKRAILKIKIYRLILHKLVSTVNLELYVHYGLNKVVKNHLIEDRRFHSAGKKLIKAQNGFGRQSDDQLHEPPGNNAIKRRRKRQQPDEPFNYRITLGRQVP